jgi:hypothetical protein
MTPSVQRGLKYAIAALETDAARGQVTLEDGTPITIGTSDDDLRAAAAWLRYETGKRASAPTNQQDN